jgi:hypothetical protein
MEFSLKRDGIAGVCGVCGDTGFPGEVDVDTAIGPPMPPKLLSCLLPETVEERLSCIEDVIDSVSALFESFIMWNLDN